MIVRPRLDSMARLVSTLRAEGNDVGEWRMHPIALLLLEREIARRDPRYFSYYGAVTLVPGPLLLFGGRVVQDTTVPMRRATAIPSR